MTQADLVAAESGWDRVVGQQRVVSQLVQFVGRPIHAFLFVGQPGIGVQEAASVFAAHVVADASADPTDALRRALAGVHPDISRVQRVGAKLLREQVVADVIKTAMMTPLEGGRRVLIVEDMHLLDEAARSALLKTVEEPPPGTVFVLCAEDTPADLATISSRCVTVEFPPLAESVIATQLRNDGVDEATIARVSIAAAGRLDRARLLVADPTSYHRFELWRSVPEVLDRSGSVIFGLVDELLASLDPVLAPILARHKTELDVEREYEKDFGIKKGAKSEAEKVRKRELRRARVDELRSGFAALSVVYRDRLLSASNEYNITRAIGSLDALAKAQEALRFNPNERLLLAGLLVRLSRLS